MISRVRTTSRRVDFPSIVTRMTTEVAPARNGDRGSVTGLLVQFDNVLNVHFPRARPCVRIRNPPPAAPVARWPMTDAHGVKVNVSPTGDTLLRGKCNPNFEFSRSSLSSGVPGLSGHSRDVLSFQKFPGVTNISYNLFCFRVKRIGGIRFCILFLISKHKEHENNTDFDAKLLCVLWK